MFYDLFGVTVLREYALLLEGTKKLSQKAVILGAIKEVVCSQKKPPAGDEIYVPGPKVRGMNINDIPYPYSGLFPAVSTPNFASKHSFESS